MFPAKLTLEQQDRQEQTECKGTEMSAQNTIDHRGGLNTDCLNVCL